MLKFFRFGFACILAAAACGHARAAAELFPVDASGGALSTPIANGQYLYVGTGSTITIWDMSAPAQPTVVGRTGDAPAPGPVRSLAVVGAYLYAVWNRIDDTAGITIYSLADPTHPVAVGEFDDYIVSDFKEPDAIIVAGTRVYLGDSEHGLVVIDATDPLHPTTTTVAGSGGAFSRMAKFGNTIVATGKNFLGDVAVTVYDATNPAAPTVAGSTTMDGFTILRATLIDGYAIGVGTQLQVYDLHDPSNISQVSATDIATAYDGVVAGNAIYLTGGETTQVWNIATPSAPTYVRDVAVNAFQAERSATTPFGAVVLTHADRGFVFGGANPLDPTLTASFPLPSVAAKGGVFDNTFGFIAEEAYGIGVVGSATLAPLARFDAALPFDPQARDMENIAVDGSRAYVAAWGYGVLIANISNPLQPTELGRFEFPFATAIAAGGNRVYVGSSTNGGVFAIVDVTNPASPQTLGTLLTSKTMDLTVRGHYAYLVDEDAFGTGGLRIVDLTNESTPTVVGQYPDCGSAEGIDVSADGNRVYIACADGTLRIVDATTRTAPTLIGTYTTPDDFNMGHSVVVNGTRAYFGHDLGVDEVDLSNPAAPTQAARHSTGFFVSKLARAPGGRVIAFASEGGTYVFATDAIFAGGFD